MEKLEKILVPIAIFLSVVGVIVFIWFLFILSKSYQISDGSKILLNETAQVGDFVGGVIGSIWALVGVVLFYSALILQRKEFIAQREELKMHRQEFQDNRISNIIYKQREIVQDSLLSLDTIEINEQLNFEPPFIEGYFSSFFTWFFKDMIVDRMNNLEKRADQYTDLEINKIIAYVEQSLNQKIEVFHKAFKTSLLLVGELIEAELIEHQQITTNNRELYSLAKYTFDIGTIEKFYQTTIFLYERYLNMSNNRDYEELIKKLLDDYGETITLIDDFKTKSTT